MSSVVTTCPRCGYGRGATPCPNCGGRARSLDGRRELPPVRADRLRDLLAGLAEVKRALFALLHGREFIGQLRLPVAMNAIAFVTVVLGGWLLLAPVFTAAFAQPWWLLDGWRTTRASDGPSLWLATSWLLLGHPLCELIAGAVQEPLRRATELRMLGAGCFEPHAHSLLRLRERARLLAWLVLLWPVALAVSLLPWLGLPIVILLGAAVAAVVWFEAPMTSRGLRLGSSLRALREHKFRALGVGLGLQLASIVPFVNVLALAPIATLASTASFLQFAKDPRG